MTNSAATQLAVENARALDSAVKQRITLSQEEKIERIQAHFGEIMSLLGLDLKDDSLKGTPRRVAKMYVTEIFQGLNPEMFPKVSLFKNSYQYNEMLLARDISLFSYCEHHFMPFTGRVHVAYFPKEHVIGLSKINRIVKYFACRPQVQERLTQELATAFKQLLQTDDIAIVIEASHMCVSARGTEDTNSATITRHISGRFENQEIMQMLNESLR